MSTVIVLAGHGIPVHLTFSATSCDLKASLYSANHHQPAPSFYAVSNLINAIFVVISACSVLYLRVLAA